MQKDVAIDTFVLQSPTQPIAFMLPDSTTYYIPLGDLPGMQFAAATGGSDPPVPQPVFYLYDHLGTTRVLFHADVNCTGGTSTHLDYVGDYYPYGKILREYIPAGEPREKYLTTQHERDAETGLDNRGARWYDSDLGRFLSVDPLAAKLLEWSSYSYALNNTLMLIDKNGKFPFPVMDTYKDKKFRIDSWFGPRNTNLSYASKNHKGLDINFGSGKFDYGAPVSTTHDGIVTVDNSTEGNEGRNVTITSPDGTFRTKYLHLKAINVKDGQSISELDQIGEIGGSRNGKEFGGQVHLHYEIQKFDPESKKWVSIDPTEGKNKSKGNIVDPQKWINVQQKKSVELQVEEMQRDNTQVVTNLPLINK